MYVRFLKAKTGRFGASRADADRQFAAFPGKIARSGDAASDPLGHWRCAQIRANQSPHANSHEQGIFQGISRL